MRGTVVTAESDVKDQRVLILTLNRPHRRNAMSDTLVDDLSEHLRSAQTSDAGALVIVGAGHGFCAGSDIAMLAGMSPEDRSEFEAASGRLAREIASHPLPILAAVHGFAIGGGLTLAAACDLVIAAANTKWSLPEVPIGLFPAWGMEAVVARSGTVFARRLAWGVDTIDGRTAYEHGLVDELAADPLAAALDLARRLAALPRSQAKAVKSYFAVDERWAERDRLANALFGEAAATAEAHQTFVKFMRPDSTS